MSRAEANLVEAVHGLVLGDTMGILVAEHESDHIKQLCLDNAAELRALPVDDEIFSTPNPHIQ